MALNDKSTDKLIEEVEKRPALYLKSSKEYADANIKRKMWEEVCSKVVEVWNDLSPNEKAKTGQDVQRRWQNLRSCFSREISTQKDVKSGQAATKRRKYVYFDKLLFLLPSVEQRPTESNASALQGDSDKEEDGVDDQHANTTAANTATGKPHSTKTKQKPTYEETLLQILRERAEKPAAVDEDTNFVLSLVPSLKALTDTEKLDAKIQILSVLRNMKSRTAPPFSTGASYIRHTPEYQSHPSHPTSSLTYPSFHQQQTYSQYATNSYYNSPPNPPTHTFSGQHLERVNTTNQLQSVSPASACSDQTIQSYISNYSVTSPQSDILDI